MSERAPCVKCGRLLHTGEGRVLMSFSADDLERLAHDTTDPAVQARALCALGLLDQERADRLVDARAEHAFKGDGYDCELCGEGSCYYLHTDRPAYEP